MMLVSIIATKKQFDKARKLNQNHESVHIEKVYDESSDINLIQFIKKNKMFAVLNIGIIGLYFSNSVLNNYMMQIVDAVGGNSEDMGRILSLMAFLEIPTMVCFDLLRKKFSCQLMLKVAAVGFTVKIVMCYLAESVAMIFAAQCFQLISFALFLPAMVHFIDEVISKGEAVKGQALFTTMVTVTTVFSSLAGGMILDFADAKMLTGIASIATAAGALIFIIFKDKVKKGE
jgi:PPP family 3-phenylpropionic acid transporter